MSVFKYSCKQMQKDDNDAFVISLTLLYVVI